MVLCLEVYCGEVGARDGVKLEDQIEITGHGEHQPEPVPVLAGLVGRVAVSRDVVTTEHADVVVVGLGVTGLSTAGALARRGDRVVGIDRWGSGHPVTSSTGASRSIRLAYDDVRYVRLARAAFEGWRRLETEQDVTLLVETGQLDIGPDVKLEALATAMREGDAPFDDLDVHRGASSFPRARDPRGRASAVPPRGRDRARRHGDAGADDRREASGRRALDARAMRRDRGRGGRSNGDDGPPNGTRGAGRDRGGPMVGRPPTDDRHRAPAGARGRPGHVPRGAGARGSAGVRRLAARRSGRRLRPSGAGDRLQGRVRRRALRNRGSPTSRHGRPTWPSRTGSSSGCTSACRRSSRAWRARSVTRGR